MAVFTRFWDAPVQPYSRLIDVNLKGVVYGSQAAIRQFRVQGYGTLVNIGSIEGEVKIIPGNIHGMLDYPVSVLVAALPWLGCIFGERHRSVPSQHSCAAIVAQFGPEIHSDDAKPHPCLCPASHLAQLLKRSRKAGS